MNHMKSFAAIPMSKCMRDMCKEEDYAFLNNQKSREIDKTPKESTFREREWQQKQEERLRRRLDREQQEQEKQCELEKQRREKEEQWKSHVAGLASERESLRGRLHRLREFRDFQKRVLMQDLGLEPGTASENLTQLLMRL
ncbi:U2 small nuclear ribonucleoprotein auxiliary factor 35 kDa subunit-related protein 1-like isoform X1 [Ictalurus punctatus]|uniref:U2 small nuclear ribonucleoprotein auxiliary factor 35 kDa subunit-related protein 1-like isoform X1 n=1 Tax=Ictalurus punctatus TaxID=7998 RepID=A0A2D0T485_ICTPU|nr:U2 small nuclear ribonucleoprotein auxiliary factor 35 kDa subunit-related protein 1-like isoform X1 [Ictalurus punctatus]XP_053544355.1 U2 small nuclear ribonucleoprotein auxiliary factor 35 kDa subunit-related protein 1-like isoform X1 [Ictalurus punctatus]XP_053544356.1 U2 small nuclear ribonucleoprotein auxiliary factor 35 kDa subunit-related protein 1-like isoform X1 [Ictalurus punctatus]XP_053544357.1 U2 small nuclear ribonucleoprotein auxiliary factor 35 kDa subunit-related protein 1-l